MANAFYQAYVEVLPDGSKLGKSLNKQFASAGPEAGRAAGDGIKSGVLGSVGKLAAPLAAAFAAVGIGSIIKDSITNASDLNEAATAITAVFGDADKTIQAFAANAATSLGQSKNMTLDAAKTFGIFGKAAGLSGQDLAGFSTDFVTLAGDLASFNNTTPEQAIEALGAGLRGESEPLRQYGVLLDDAALKARATELGIYSGTGALTQQQKVLAAQAEILAQTSTQQGDFARTSGGLANQQRILAAQLENLSTSFGQLLLPIMVAVVGFLNRSVLPAFSNIGPAIDLIVGSFTGAGADVDLGGWTNPLIDFGATLRTVFDTVSPLIKSFGDMFKPVFASIGPLFDQLAPVFGALIPQLVELWQAFSPLSLILKAIGPLLPQIVGVFGELAATLAGALGQALTAVMPNITTMAGLLVGLIGGLISALLPVIVQLVGMLGPLLGTVIAAILPLIVQLQGVFLQLFAAVLPLLSPILALIAPLAQLIGAILPPLIQLFVAILTPIIGLASIIISLLVPVLGFVITVLSAVIGWVAKVITWFVNLVTGSGKAGAQLKAAWDRTMGMFADFFSNTFGMFRDFGTNVANAVSGLVGTVGGFFSDLWSNASTAFSDGIGTVVGFVEGLPGKILTALGDMGSFLVNAGSDLIQGFIDGIKGMLGNVGDAIGGVMDFVGGFFPHSPAKRGYFSGSGWTGLLKSGAAIGDQFGAGLNGNLPVVDLASKVTIPSASAQINATVGGSSSASSPLVQIVNKTGVALSDLIDVRIRQNGREQYLSLGNGVA